MFVSIQTSILCALSPHNHQHLEHKQKNCSTKIHREAPGHRNTVRSEDATRRHRFGNDSGPNRSTYCPASVSDIRAGHRISVHGAALCAVLAVCLRNGGNHIHRFRARRRHTDNGRQYAVVRMHLWSVCRWHFGGSGRSDRLFGLYVCDGNTVAESNVPAAPADRRTSGAQHEERITTEHGGDMNCFGEITLLCVLFVCAFV